MNPNGVPLIMLLVPMGMVMFVVGLPVILGIRAEHRKREMEHLERMRAIELGRPFPSDAGWWSPSRLAVGIGIGVPIGVFGIAWLAALTTEAAAPFIWPSAGGVGLAAVICGTILAARIVVPPPVAPNPHAKPYVNPDAYDVAEHQHS